MTNSPTDLPRLCADLPATGGRLRTEAADFVVDEVPVYEASGEGQHLFLHIEKTGLGTEDVVRWLRREGLLEIGYAGRKDRHAVTRQFFSVERRRWTEEIAGRAPDGVRILSATPHANKLKLGHLRGNRFSIRVRGARIDTDAVEAITKRITERGLPNFFGEQRFGMRGDNAAEGLLVLRGKRRMPKNQAMFLLSALQSDLFNRLLARRLADDTWRRVLEGDVLKKTETGGLFVTSDPSTDQPRLEAGLVAPAGPLFGPAMPEAAGVARAYEDAVLAEADLTRDDWANRNVRTTGSRRALIVYPEGLRAQAEPDGTLVLEFFLPKGSFGTVLLREYMGDAP